MARHRADLEMRHVAWVAGAGVFAAACGGTIPTDGTNAMLTTPSVVSASVGTAESGGVSQTLAQDVVTFSLDKGTFTFTTTRGEMTGTFGGFVTVPAHGRSTVAMTLQVTGGTKDLSGATGILVGNGGGAFVTGGQFVLSLTGDLQTTAVPQRSKFHATVMGTAALPLTCSGSNHLISQLRGEGTITTIGRSVMELDSEILETNCL